MQDLLVQLVNLGGFLGMLIFIAYSMYVKQGKPKELPPLWAQELQEHFNHDITELLRDIRDGVNETNNTLRNWEKYGSPTIKG